MVSELPNLIVWNSAQWRQYLKSGVNLLSKLLAKKGVPNDDSIGIVLIVLHIIDFEKKNY